MPLSWIESAPKVELHLHHIGATSLPTVARLAARHPDAGVPADPDELATFYEFTDFDHFLRTYLAVSRLVTTADDVFDLTIGNLNDLATQNVRYAEVTVTPNVIMANGVPRDGLVEALNAARAQAARDWDLAVGWILDIPGVLGPGADLVVDLCEQRPPDGLVALGLGGPELPRRDFAPYFARARALGLGSVPHAGEGAGPENIRAAIDHLAPDRIGHGVRIVEDPALVTEVAERGLHLEVCPTSNVRTRVVASIEDHPLAQLVAAGIPVSVNSDDPPMFGTTLTRELKVAAALLGEEQVPQLLRNAIHASFAPDHVKRTFLDELAAAEAQLA